MTKYSEAGKGDATRPTNHEAFSSNFDRIFSGGAKRGSYIQDPKTGKLVPKDEYYGSSDVDAPMIQPDINGYKSMVTGEWIGSRSQHREHLKQHRLVEIGNETKAHMTKTEPKRDRERLRRDIAEQLNRYGY